jgi:hypothetical protein
VIRQVERVTERLHVVARREGGGYGWERVRHLCGDGLACPGSVSGFLIMLSRH